MNEKRINLTCGLCERPVLGVHFLWDTNGAETMVWFHGDTPEDQCFMHKAAKMRPEVSDPLNGDNTD